MRSPVILTGDGYLDPKTVGDVRIDERYDAPSIDGHMVVALDGDYEIGAVRDASDAGTLDVIGKSGHSRVGLHIARRENETITFDRTNIIVPVSLHSLRAVADRRGGVRDHMMTVLQHSARSENLHVGRLMDAQQHNALSAAEVREAMMNYGILFGRNVDIDAALQEDGSILLPLEDVQYLLCEDNFTDDAMRSVLRFGKHGLSGVQDSIPHLQSGIDPREFLVGGVRLSLGPYIAVVDEELNDERVMHLAARVLDGIRTTGQNVFRQVELFNASNEKIPTIDLKVRVRLYPGSRNFRREWERFHKPHVIRNGVSFSDAVGIETYPERLIDAMSFVSPTKADKGSYGLLVSSKRSAFVQWQQTPAFQARHLEMRGRQVAAADDAVCTFLDRMPPAIAAVAERLRYVGGEQNEGHACLTWALPDSHTIERLLSEGTGVFAFHDLSTRQDAFSTENPLISPSTSLEEKNGRGFHRGKPTNNLYLDGDRFTNLQSQHARGARFFLVRHAAPDRFGNDNNAELAPEILEWDRRGVWLRPGRKEAFDKVDTMIAMYGSHVHGMDVLLHEQIVRFAVRMKRQFGESVAFVHGKGPGVMHVADDVASRLPDLVRGMEEYKDIQTPIFTVGIGIDAERIGQMPNFHSDAQADFFQKDRLVRQKHMNDRSTINVFNIGGAGTLEELALSLCSQKLNKNIPAPLILVDPLGFGENGDNLWQELVNCVHTLSEKKEITTESAATTIQLLQEYMANFLHLVSSYDEAADIIERFAHDPVEYYVDHAKIPRKALELAYDESAATFRETGFSVPAFLDRQTVLSDSRWSEQR
jgi:predicted Rossmann-fold nucleotide-binding protein